jgi:AraC family transcriptional regulator, regulatory protein of adaptative response / DNA-3-methyladenine glycosylase II
MQPQGKGRKPQLEVMGLAELRLHYRPPFEWRGGLAFLAMRAIPGVEAIAGNRYCRSVALDGARGCITVALRAAENALTLIASEPLAPMLPAVAARLRRMFDLDADPLLIGAHLSADSRLAPLIRGTPGLRVPGAWDGFELAVRAVLGQQVSVRGASTLAGRLAERYGTPLPGRPGRPSQAILRCHPDAATLADAGVERIASIGLPRRRAQTLRALAREVADQRLVLDGSADAAATIAALKALPGIGDWTAQYIAMRALRWTDAFPAGDLGLRKALSATGLRSERELARAAEAWRPWRAYAAMHLWHSLAGGAAGGHSRCFRAQPAGWV